MPTVQIRINDDPVSGFDLVFVVFRNGFHNTGQLMPDDSGICNELICPAESTDIATADSGRRDSNQLLRLLSVPVSLHLCRIFPMAPIV